MWSMYSFVMVKKELSRRAKFSIYQSIYIPNLTYSHEPWVNTERMRFWIQVVEMSFLHRVAVHPGGAEPLLPAMERSQLRWLGHLPWMPP